MGGDVWQWTEGIVSIPYNPAYRAIRGGDFYNYQGLYSDGLASSYRDFCDPAYPSFSLGFRVASLAVPEPGSLALLLAGAVALLAYAWRRRRV
jgi:formylglycine-generating enzyme required for sulfatase activity